MQLLRVSCGAAAAAVMLLLVVADLGKATELTFDMGPHERQCFFEVAQKDDPVSFEYQVRLCL